MYNKLEKYIKGNNKLIFTKSIIEGVIKYGYRKC